MATQDPNLLNITGSVIKDGTIHSLEVNSDTKDIQLKSTTNSREETLTNYPKYELLYGDDFGIGSGSLANYETPIESKPNGRLNVAIGTHSLEYLTNEFGGNVAIGSYAGHKNNGSSNTYIGTYSGAFFNVNTGIGNTHVGAQGPIYATSGDYNVSLGANCFFDLTTGSGNMAVGYGSLPNVTSGSNNLAMGYLSGRDVVLGDSNTFIGYLSGDGLGDTSNTLSVGAGTRKDIFADANGIKLGDDTLATEVFEFVLGNAANLNYADDTAAAAGGVPLNGIYHTSGTIKVRLV